MSGYKIFPSTKFKKDYKKFINQPKPLKAIQTTILLLSQKGSDGLPKELKSHQLIGNYKGNWECHLLPDLLLIWEQLEDPKEIILIRVGSHSELFK